VAAPRIAIETFVRLTEDAYRGDPDQGLLGNLRDIREQDRTELPDDAELDRERLTNWGDRLPTRDLIRIIVGHDFYHAGEIDHVRALLQGTDGWPY